MDAMELLATCRSVSKLKEPAPDDAVLDRVVRAALRAPDHGALRPWKVLLVRGDARAKLGALLVDSLLRRNASASQAEIDKERNKVLRAPLVVIVAATIKPSPKAPEIEQLLSAGAVMHGLLLGLQVVGFGAVWKTGAPTYDEQLVVKLGLAATDKLVGFLYVGTPAEEPPALPRPEPSAHVIDWNG
ncbi:MAG: nitroreductase [Polyangiaceae bacterium]